MEETPRLLQTDDSNTAHLTQTEIIRSTCLIYVSIFAALFVLFLIVRPRYPHVYNIKKSYPALYAPIAAKDDSLGTFSWIWKVFDIEDKDICEQCGMDAATTIRLLELGVKLSIVGVFNSAFLVPVYALMGNVIDNNGQTDPVKACSLSNLEQGHVGAIATTIAAYIFFLSAMHMIDKDFEWFTFHRNNFLSKKRHVPNYSIYLSCLPPEMQTNVAIKEYFNKCFSHDAVADVHVALDIRNLEKKVARRDKLLPKLEHAMNIHSVKGEMPTHKTKICGGERVESIPVWQKEIDDLNEEIGNRIHRIEMLQSEREAFPLNGNDVEASETKSPANDNDDAKENPSSLEMQAVLDNNDEHPVQMKDDKGSKLANKVVKSANAGTSIIKMLQSGEDGALRNACFVSFRDLTSANLARQAVHNHEPWCCVPVEPPVPELVNWKNVGKSNSSKQIGELISFVLTAILCIFWSIPVAFVASLSNVESLTELLPFLKQPVENFSWFSGLLAVLAPLILVAFISLLPTIILMIIKFEGLIEIETYQHPSLFAKLGIFTIIQTFFISTIASSLFSSLQTILNNPTSGFALLAQALPAQSAYFIQIIIVQNVLGLGIELLRFSPIITNIVRRIASNILGHNLTEKERGETFLGLRSLDDPLEYHFGRELGMKTVLVQMVLYVYGCMAPVTSYFTLLVFGLLAIGFRHQFIFIYPVGNDSGGTLWLNFTRLSVTCMIIAELVLFMVLLLKQTYIAAMLLLPLIAGTILFDIYFKRRHYSITSYLPLGECAFIDDENVGMSLEWLMKAYLQPALKERVSLSSASAEDVEELNILEEEGDVVVCEDQNDLAEEHKLKGNYHMSSKKYDLALQEYSLAIDKSPSGPNAHIYYSNRAAAHCYLGDYGAAADDCRTSICLNPTYEKAHTRLGLSLYFQEDYQGAVNAYEKSLDLDPTNQECFNYMVRAKEKLATQHHDEIEVMGPPSICGGGVNCWDRSFDKSRSFDPSITNDD